MKTGIYLAKKGHHRFKTKAKRVNLYHGKLNFNIVLRFDKSCLYNPNDISHSGVNKLLGFTRICHHEHILGKLPYIKNKINSWLIGWKVKMYNGEYKIALYRYFDCLGKETIDPSPFTYIDPDKDITIVFFEFDNMVKVSVYQKETDNTIIPEFKESVEYPKKVDSPLWGYFLYPYFGGRSTAPHDMKIEIKKFRYQ